MYNGDDSEINKNFSSHELGKKNLIKYSLFWVDTYLSIFPKTRNDFSIRLMLYGCKHVITFSKLKQKYAHIINTFFVLSHYNSLFLWFITFFKLISFIITLLSSSLLFLCFSFILKPLRQRLTKSVHFSSFFLL